MTILFRGQLFDPACEEDGWERNRRSLRSGSTAGRDRRDDKGEGGASIDLQSGVNDKLKDCGKSSGELHSFWIPMDN
jgi:hypothetical protein